MNSLVKLNTMADTSDSESLQVPAPVAVTYDKLLIQQDETIHAIIQDILSCTIEDIKRTKTVDMMEVLENFSGSSPHKKKAELLDFLLELFLLILEHFVGFFDFRFLLFESIF